MIKKIAFVTTNNGKFEEVARWVADLDATIVLEQVALDVPEYQSLDIATVALGKAQEAWRMLERPLLIDDGGIYIEQYHLFPGTLSKYVYQGIGLDGIWKLAQNDPRTNFLSYLVYITGPEKYYHFEGICSGKLVEPTQHKAHVQLPYTSMFTPDGSTKTLAELRGSTEEKQFHHRYKALQKLVTFLQN